MEKGKKETKRVLEKLQVYMKYVGLTLWVPNYLGAISWFIGSSISSSTRGRSNKYNGLESQKDIN